MVSAMQRQTPVGDATDSRAAPRNAPRDTPIYWDM